MRLWNTTKSSASTPTIRRSATTHVSTGSSNPSTSTAKCGDSPVLDARDVASERRDTAPTASREDPGRPHGSDATSKSSSDSVRDFVALIPSQMLFGFLVPFLPKLLLRFSESVV